MRTTPIPKRMHGYIYIYYIYNYIYGRRREYIYIYIYIYITTNDRPAKPPRRWFVRVDRDTAPTAYFCSPPIGGWSTAQADPQAGPPRRWPVYRAGGPSSRATTQVAGLPRRWTISSPRRWPVYRAGGPSSNSTTQVASPPRRWTSPPRRWACYAGTGPPTHSLTECVHHAVCHAECPREVTEQTSKIKKATHNKNHKEYRFSVDPATATRSPASVGPLDKIGACRARALQSFTAAGCGCGACTQATCSKTPPSKKKAPFYTSLPCAVIGHCPCAYVPRSCTILSRIRVSASRVFPDFT